ncbi:MAG: KH domain-containing protein [Acidimicrobiales bacterium]
MSSTGAGGDPVDGGRDGFEDDDAGTEDLDDDAGIEDDDAGIEDDDAGIEELDDDAGNRVTGAVPLAVLEFVARSIVDDPDAVVIEADERRGRVDLHLTVARDDMGKIIGRRGRVAQSIRTLVRAAGAREGIDASVEIVD